MDSAIGPIRAYKSRPDVDRRKGKKTVFKEANIGVNGRLRGQRGLMERQSDSPA